MTVIDKVWKCPSWLKARWIAMEADGIWSAFLGNMPVREESTWDWGDPDTCTLRAAIHLDPHMFNWTPPRCDNWENSLREIRPDGVVVLVDYDSLERPTYID